MPFTWETQKATFTGKLKVNSFGRVGNIGSQSEVLTTDHTSITYVNCGSNEVGVTESELGKTRSVTKVDQGGTKVWGLPWEAGYAGRTKLGAGGPSVFLTPSLNGCCVMIGGTTTEPVVVHANCQPRDLLTPYAAPQQVKTYMRLWSDVYVTICSQLFAKGFLPDTNLELLQPSAYMLPGVSEASVFGIRTASAWAFYVVVNSAASGKTTKFWG